MSFHSKMTKLRKIRHMSQEEFAAAIGVSRQSVYKWESGQSYPEVERLLKIARTFGVTVDDMLNDELDINRKGEAVPVEEVEKEEAELFRKKQERAARRQAREQEKKEQEAAAVAEAPAATEAPAAEEAKEEVPAAEEAKEEVPAAEEAAPAAEEAPAEAEEEPKKRKGLFGWLRR